MPATRTSLPRCVRTGGAGQLAPRAPRTVLATRTHLGRTVRTAYCGNPGRRSARSSCLAGTGTNERANEHLVEGSTHTPNYDEPTPNCDPTPNYDDRLLSGTSGGSGSTRSSCARRPAPEPAHGEGSRPSPDPSHAPPVAVRAPARAVPPAHLCPCRRGARETRTQAKSTADQRPLSVLLTCLLGKRETVQLLL